MNKHRILTAVGLATTGLLAGFGLKTVLAEGIPSPNPLYYSGTLTENGSLVNGTRAITVNLWRDATTGGTPLCQTVVSSAPVTSGRFRIALASSCKAIINQNPNAYVEVIDGATSLARSPIGAVPYAVEADHAVNATNASGAAYAVDAGHASTADNATTATNATTAATANAAGGTLATTISTIQGMVHPSLLRPTPFFNWSTVVVSSSDTEAFPSEGQQTITFPQAGYYRITLDAQVIHDGGTTSVIHWYVGGTATRLDPYSLEAGGQISFVQSAASQDSRQVESTVLFVNASASQTLTLNPSLTVTYSSANLHEAQFMYSAEYLGQ